MDVDRFYTREGAMSDPWALVHAGLTKNRFHCGARVTDDIKVLYAAITESVLTRLLS